MQQSSIEFLPSKISTSKYERRLNQCTKQQLSQLLTSPEYLEWQNQQQATVQDNAAGRTKSSSISRGAYLALLLLLPALFIPYYLPLVRQQVFPKSQQQGYSQPDRTQTYQSSQEQHTGSTYLIDSHRPDAYDPASFSDGNVPDAQHEQQPGLELAYDWTKEAAAPDMQTAYNRSAEADAPIVPAETVKGEGPHPWFGDMPLVHPSAAFGICAAVALLVSLVMHCKHQQAIVALRRRVQRLKFQLAQAFKSKEERDGERETLQQQLTKMEEVQGQLDSAAKALQGKSELQEQQIEVLQLDLLAKDKALALQEALAASSVDTMEGDTEEIDEADTDAAVAPELGMLTPPQPVPRDNAAEAAPEEEMSFTGLVDDGDEDVHEHGPGEQEKASASAKVLVYQDDVDNWAAMEQSYTEVQEHCEELQLLLMQREDQLCSLHQELTDTTSRLQGDVNSKDKAVGDLKRWLDQAQGQLQNTQAALHEREADCKTLAADLKAALAHLAAHKDKAADGALEDDTEAEVTLRQHLRESRSALEVSQDQLRLREEEVEDLSQHLQAAQADIASLQAQLAAAEAREGALAREQEAVQGALTGQVAGVMHMMRGLRMSLSSKLTDSHTTCQALVQDLAAQNSFADDLEGSVEHEHSHTRQSLSSGPDMSSFSAFTPSSTLALTANGADAPASESGSVAGPLALTPIRHVNLTPAGTFEMTPEAVTANSSTPESAGWSVGGPLALTPSPMPARLPVHDNPVEHGQTRSWEVGREAASKHGSPDKAQSSTSHNEEERENVPPQGTPPSLRKAMAVKRVKDTYMRLGQWNLVTFLKEMGCNPEVESAPVTQAEFDRVKDNGLRALHPANQQGKDEVQKVATAEARAILEAWQWPVPKVCLKPNSPYWFAR